MLTLLIASMTMTNSKLEISSGPQLPISPLLYSLFFETEINFGGEGGVYAELVSNRDFEALGRGRLPESATTEPNVFCGAFAAQVYQDEHDGDQKEVTVAEGKITIKPYNNTQKWLVTSDWDPVACTAMINFNVPGKPNPPPVPLKLSYYQGTGGNKSVLPFLVFTDPSGTLPPGPLNTWVGLPGKPKALPYDPNEPAPKPTDFRPWSALNTATLSIDNTTAPFPTNPHSLKVVAGSAGATGAGAANPGYWGIAVRKGVSFNLTLYAKASTVGAALRLVAKLTDGGIVLASAAVEPAAADPTAPAPQQGWKRYSATLVPGAVSSSARLEVALADDHQDGTYWLDSVSLVPSDALGPNGLFRKDIVSKLQKMKPGFMRTPGGNYLEGTGLRTRWNWKATLGAAATRPGHYNSAWGYWVTDGLGVYELLTLCELLNSTCQMSVYTGYSMGRQYIPLEQSEVFAQDAIDLLDFANADASTSTYAAMRVKMGRKAPFRLTRVEVGNEERAMEGYASHYKLITSKLWQRYPDLTIVASGRWGPSIKGSPCLSGQRCDVWDDHYYRHPDVMAGMGAVYDDYNRSLPKVFVGEFAAKSLSTKERSNTGVRTLRAALAEGIFMIGFERNADVVVASSFAPLCNNMKGTQWSYNLINFNASNLFVLPSYHAQVLLSSNLGANTLPTKLTPPYEAATSDADTMVEENAPPAPPRWQATASLSASGTLIVKMVNYGPSARAVDVSYPSAAKPIAKVLSAKVLTAASPDAQNTLDDPDAVEPKVLTPAPSVVAGGLNVVLPPWSLVVIEAK